MNCNERVNLLEKRGGAENKKNMDIVMLGLCPVVCLMESLSLEGERLPEAHT